MCTFLVFLAFVVYAPDLLFTQGRSLDILPRSFECGYLREEQFFNLQTDVQPNELNWMMPLAYKNNSDILCMGTLIHEKYLLAPAQCFDESAPPPELIKFGSCTSKDTECSSTDKFEVIIHPKYDERNKDATSQEYNIALMRLEEPVKFSRFISPICLPTEADEDKNYVGQHMTVTGQWTTGKRKSRKFFALIQSLSQCRDSFGEVSDRFICANICDTESTYIWGSALLGTRIKNSQVNQYYLAALDTIGDERGCDELAPDIFVRIDHLVQWITDTIVERETT